MKGGVYRMLTKIQALQSLLLPLGLYLQRVSFTLYFAFGINL